MAAAPQSLPCWASVLAQGHDDLGDALGRFGRGGSGASAPLCAPGGIRCQVAIPPFVEPTFRAGQFPADVLYRVACQVSVDGSLSALFVRFCHGELLWSLSAIRARLLFVLDVMAQSSRLVKPIRPPLWCERYTAPSPSGALLRHVAALGRGQRLWVTGFGPLALVGTQLAEALQFVRVCP